MIIASEAAMLAFGAQIAENLTLPAVIELVGDVGAGKTTFTRGLAHGLGITEPITSPSFTISKRYTFPLQTQTQTQNQAQAQLQNQNQNQPQPSAFGELIHYDFYRLPDPGLMRDELTETLAQPHSVTVVEWGESVADLLPASKLRFEITLRPDGSREVSLK